MGSAILRGLSPIGSLEAAILVGLAALSGFILICSLEAGKDGDIQRVKSVSIPLGSWSRGNERECAN
jgi:hypothetical protein